MKRFILLFLSALIPFITWAQCAMCRTQIKNNVSSGDTTLAEGLNNGIMFLFFTPYIVVIVIIILWYRYSKVNEGKISLIQRLRGQVPKVP
ncbi:MAG: hypothetical protein AAF600_00795 [Bacteroidota bacterium]